MYSVSRIRNSIRNKEYIFPNEKLIVIHLVNYLISSIFSFVQTSFLFIIIRKDADWYDKKIQHDPSWQEARLSSLKYHFVGLILQITQFIWDTYTTVFLIYVIYKFSAEGKSAKVHDNILGKEVSSLVFIKNQRLVREAYKKGLTYDDEIEQEIRARAQLNEHMHYLLKKHGVVMKMDEDISVSFMYMPIKCDEEFYSKNSSVNSDPLIVSFSTSNQE